MEVGEGARGGAGIKHPHALTERHSSVPTPTSANRCDQFNEALRLGFGSAFKWEALLSEKSITL